MHAHGRRLALLGVTLTVAGCAMVRVEPTVDASASPREDAGYVAAAFWVRSQTETFTFVLVDAAGRQRDIAFRDLTPPKKTHFDPAVRGDESNTYTVAETKHLAMIAVPPGEYRVAYWRRGMYGSKAELLPVKEGSAIARPFRVRAGHVAFLGRFRAREDRLVGPTDRIGYQKVTFVWSIVPDGPPAEEASSILRSAYPGFARAPLECIACSDVARPRAPTGPLPRGVYSL